VLALATPLFLTGLFKKLPEATLVAIVTAAVVELVDIASLRRLWRVQTGRLAGWPASTRSPAARASSLRRPPCSAYSSSRRWPV
jgi:hypothetical protein